MSRAMFVHPLAPASKNHIQRRFDENLGVVQKIYIPATPYVYQLTSS